MGQANQKNVKKSLQSIAKLSSGFSFRGSTPTDEDGSILVIQASDIGQDGTILFDDLKKIKEKSAPETAILHDGDVLLVSRGIGSSGFRSAVFREASNKAIATSALQVIRVVDNDMSPEYLCAYLNSNRGQSDLMKITTGSSVKMVSLSELKNLRIFIPDKPTQQTFSKLVSNINTQKHLLTKKQILLDQVRKASTSQIIK